MQRNVIRGAAAMLLAAVGPLVAGCYTYADVTPSQVPLGTAVRARVPEAVAIRVEPIVGYRTTTLSGVVNDRDSTGLRLRVPARTFTESGTTRRFYQMIHVGPGDVLDLQAQHLSFPRTLGLAAAGVAAIVFVFTRSAGSSVSGGPPTPTGKPN